VTDDATCSTASDCAQGKSCLHGFCISPFRTNLADFCDTTMPCPTGQSCYYGFCSDPQASVTDITSRHCGIPTRSIGKWPLRPSSTRQRRHRYYLLTITTFPIGFNDPYANTGLDSGQVLGADIIADTADQGVFDPAMCVSGFGSFFNSLTSFNDVSSYPIPAFKTAIVSG